MTHSPSLLPASILFIACAAAAARASGPDASACAAARATFATTCARCHNADGTGYIPIGTPDFTDPKWQAAHSDAELENAVRSGVGGRMPPFGAAFSNAQIEALVTCVVRGFGEVKARAGRGARPVQAPPPRMGATLPPPGRGAGPVMLGSVGVYTEHNTNERTGANLRETTLTPRNVNARQFGLLFRQVVDDQVYTQPLYVPNLPIAGGRHNVVYVATVANTVYAFDADTERPAYWHVNLGPPASIQEHPAFWCQDILGNMGIIGTPVIDPVSRTLYVVALTDDGGRFVQRLHALDLCTGAERPHSPVAIAAPLFDAIMQNQRPALLLSDGRLYVGYSSHCDVGPYHGFLFRFDPETLRQEGVFDTCPAGDGGSIWQSGQGPAADGAGNIYFVTSNGVWDGKRNFSDSFLRLSPDERLLDWFTPSDYDEINRSDLDLNSSGAMLIPGAHEVIGVGKQGIAYLLDTRRLGHLGGEHAVQRVKISATQINGSAVFWRSAARGDLIYYWPQLAKLLELGFDGRRLNPVPLAVGQATAAYPGAMLSISADGGRDGILWANAAPLTYAHPAAVLRAYDANDVARELWDSNQDAPRDSLGWVSKNAPPTVVNGKVYVSSFGALQVGTGALYVYGLLPRNGGGSASGH